MKGLFFNNELVVVLGKEEVFVLGEDIEDKGDNESGKSSGLLVLGQNNELLSLQKIPFPYNRSGFFVSKSIIATFNQLHRFNNANMFLLGNTLRVISEDSSYLYTVKGQELVKNTYLSKIRDSSYGGQDLPMRIKLLYLDDDKALLFVERNSDRFGGREFSLVQLDKDETTKTVFAMNTSRDDPLYYHYSQTNLIHYYPEMQKILFNFYEDKQVYKMGILDLNTSSVQYHQLNNYDFPVIGAALRSGFENELILISLKDVFIANLEDDQLLALNQALIKELKTPCSQKVYFPSPDDYFQDGKGRISVFPLHKGNIGIAFHGNLSYEMNPFTLEINHHKAFKPEEIIVSITPIIIQSEIERELYKGFEIKSICYER